MPLYEYECSRCGIRFERVQRFSDEPLHVCPECGGAVNRLIQPVGIVFKGSGFYVTDNRAASSTATPGSASSRSERKASDTATGAAGSKEGDSV